MRIKKTAAAIVIIAGLALAGCTAGGGGGGEASGGGTDESGTIRLITPTYPANSTGQQALNRVIDKFHEAYPNVEVEVDFANFGNLSQKLTTSIASGQDYDVVMAGFAWAPPLAKLGVLADLADTQFTEDALLSDIGKENDVLLDAVRYQDSIYAVPLIVQPRVFAYSASAFEAAGLDPDKPPTSLAEVREYAKKLTVRDGAGNITQAGFDLWTTAGNYRQGFITGLGALGQTLYKDGDTPNWNNSEGVEALEWMRGIFDDKSAVFGYANASQIPLVTLGEAAMGFMSPYVNCSDAGIGQEKCDDLRFANLSDKDSVTFAGGQLVGISPNTKLPEASLAFIDALRTQDSLNDIAALSSGLPIKAGAGTDEFVSSNPASTFAITTLPNMVFEGGTDNWLDIRAAFGPAIDEVLLGRTEPADALASIEAVAQQ